MSYNEIGLIELRGRVDELEHHVAVLQKNLLEALDVAGVQSKNISTITTILETLTG